MAPRLKTFITSDGFTDYIVAVSSKPKALAAWGVRQDLFQEGRAHETDDPELVKAAEASPGEVITRRVADLAKLTDRPMAEVIRFTPAAKEKPDAKLGKPKSAPKPWAPAAADVRRLADLERRRQASEARYAEVQDALALERQRLDEREARERSRFRAERDELASKLAAARRRLRPP